MWYDLDGQPISVAEANELLGSPRRFLKRTDLVAANGASTAISTVFLVLDHGLCEGSRLLWETMVFGTRLMNAQTWRYSSQDQALREHDEIVLSAEVAMAMEGAKVRKREVRGSTVKPMAPHGAPAS